LAVAFPSHHKLLASVSVMLLVIVSRLLYVGVPYNHSFQVSVVFFNVISFANCIV